MTRIFTILLLLVSALAVAFWLFRGADTAPDEEKTIHVFLPSSENPFWIDVRSGAEAAGRENDSYQVRIQTSGEFDGAQQVEQLRSVLSRGNTDGIVIGLANNSVVAPVVAQYNAADIPVVLIDTELDPEASSRADAKVDAFIGSDNRYGGLLAADTMLEAVSNSDNKKTVLLIKGSYVHQSAIDRAEGFIEGIGDALRIIERDGEWQRERANEVTLGVLAREPVSGIFASNDEMALGAIAAIESMDLVGDERPIVIGFDATAEGVKAVESGQMHATIRQKSFEMGKSGVEQAIKLASDEVIEDPRVTVPLEVVRKED